MTKIGILALACLIGFGVAQLNLSRAGAQTPLPAQYQIVVANPGSSPLPLHAAWILNTSTGEARLCQAWTKTGWACMHISSPL